MMTVHMQAVKTVARVSLERTGLWVSFLSDGTALLSCAHVGVCEGCYREWETGDAVLFTPDQAQHLALALRPLLSVQEFRAITQALRECLEPVEEGERESAGAAILWESEEEPWREVVIG